MSDFLKHPPEDPFIIFDEWHKQAFAEEGIHANVMSLASVNYLGQPSLRVMMLNKVINHTFVFFTNMESRKALEILDNPHVALSFFWPTLKRQIRVEGVASKVADDVSDKVFANRPQDHQINIIASEQSRLLSDTSELEQKMAEIACTYGEDAIPRPPKWGGFAITPSRIEFWQEQPFWMHERVVYTDYQGEWSYSRLYP